MKKELLEAIAVTAELTGTELSQAAARVMAQDLSRYPIEQVLPALTRCRKELKGRMTIADVVTRLDDGRPGPEEAWAMIPKDEYASCVWTEEMARASGVSRALIESGDLVAARMAFLESYRAALLTARDAGAPVRWTPSLGYDQSGREAALIEAARMGRIPAQHAQALLPHRDVPAPEIMALVEQKRIGQ